MVSADSVGLSGGRAVATSGAGAAACGFAAATEAGVIAAGAADGPALLATAFGFAAGVGTGAAGAVVAVAVVSEPPMPTFLARLLKKPPSDEADATRVEGAATTGSSDAANSERRIGRRGRSSGLRRIDVRRDQCPVRANRRRSARPAAPDPTGRWRHRAVWRRRRGSCRRRYRDGAARPACPWQPVRQSSHHPAPAWR